MPTTVDPRILRNRAAHPQVEPAPFGAPTRAPLDFHRRLPGYARTPLVDAAGLAAGLGVRRVLIKAETTRLTLPSYKILGAAWAIYREVIDTFGLSLPEWSTVDELAEAVRPVGPLTLVAATDGNHGRAVAHVARLLGWRSHIYVPAGTVDARIDGIQSEGATVEVVDGSYDEAVQRSAGDAAPDTLVISDTAWSGYDRVPRRVIQGYSTIFWEIEDELAERDLEAPTMAVVQMGVGSLAAAAVLHYRTGDRARPLLVGAEPLDAACVLASIEAGHVAEVPGPHRSIMAGLNCGFPSPLAFPLIAAGMDTFVAVDDEAARQGMRDLAAAGIEAGESGAAGLAAVTAAAATGVREATGLTADATLLLLCTEGATDPEAYRAILSAETAGSR